MGHMGLMGRMKQCAGHVAVIVAIRARALCNGGRISPIGPIRPMTFLGYSLRRPGDCSGPTRVLATTCCQPGTTIACGGSPRSPLSLHNHGGPVFGEAKFGGGDAVLLHEGRVKLRHFFALGVVDVHFML